MTKKSASVRFHMWETVRSSTSESDNKLGEGIKIKDRRAESKIVPIGCSIPRPDLECTWCLGNDPKNYR